MNAVFIAVLLMSATGGLLELCLSLLHPLTRKTLTATWHYRMYMLVVLFLLVPIGVIGGSFIVSIQPENNQGFPNVPAALNEMITVRQADRLPQLQHEALTQADLISTANTAPVITAEAILQFLPLFWVLGFLTFIIWHGIQLVRFKKKIVQTSLQVMDAEKLSVFENTMLDMKIKGGLRLFSNDIVKTPMLVGLLKTYLILPEVEMSSMELKVILKHELVHFKRRDLLVKSLALAANAIHWFNPAAYRLTKKIDAFCELSCDEQVVSDMNMEERRFYGETILNVLCRVVSQHSGVYATLAESKKGIEQRLIHLMNFKKNPKRIVIISTIAAVALGISGCAMASIINVNRDDSDNSSSISTEGNGELPVEVENAAFLGNDGDTQYYWTLEGDSSVLYTLEKSKLSVKQLAVFPPRTDTSPDSIIDFGICGDWIILSIGHYEGSGSYFYGDFARMKKDGSELEHFWLTDDDTFDIIDDWIYYNYWTVKDSPADGDGCYRIRPDGTGREYMGDILYSIFLYDDQDGYVYGEHDTGKTISMGNPMTDLIRCNPDGSELITLFSGDSLPKFDNSDYIRYSDIEVTGAYITFTASVHGYSEGDSWWGHYNYIADYRVDKDGSNLMLLRDEYPVPSATDTVAETPSGILYVNERLGFSVEFPADWEGLFGITENYLETSERGGADIAVYQKASRDADTDIGTIFFIERWIGTWTEEEPPIYAGGSSVVLQSGKYTYMLRTPSDVQYIESDQKIADEYRKMYDQLDDIRVNVKNVYNSYSGSPEEKEFLDSPDGKKMRTTAFLAAKAMLTADADKLASYLIKPDEASGILRNMADVTADLNWLCFKFSLDSIISADEIRLAYEYALNDDDSFSYVTMTLNKVDSEWKVSFIGIEK